ncbi:bifunctional diguanylate cyclase/phosphodiesterase [Candidimonas sp. SYP-B2681]|uniref:putative bifunctional diguanylate cyclase/phosphodiesterase n=1 Tax=Candidimonas sp. SYP-B2681 TaxID=2497686 RepID=UPI000F8966EB|nr:bifunctional diguanylate cyclase/phosphodiesterase [Candidimonas sp. SYP-B2681]RTZ45377.1 bifunctional diguanylate cyclase/phosphodiesterase [Candidimonas sp. SYP-B2681]
MTASNALRQTFFQKLTASVDRLVYYFSLYAVPVSIVLFSILAVYAFTSHYPPAQGRPLSIRVLPQGEAQYSPSVALAAVRTQAATFAPKVSTPSWFLVDIPAAPQLGTIALDIPSHFMQTLDCWKADSLSVMGSANRTQTNGALQANKMGFAVLLDQLPSPTALLCYATFAGSSTLTAELWRTSDLRAASSRFDRGTGLLEGGLLTIALFILIIAITNREWVYLLLATWLVGNLRLGAFALGWDGLWLGQNIPLEWMQFIRQITIAAYYLLTYTLLTQLFRTSNRPYVVALLRLVQWAGLVLLAGAVLLPYSSFQPLMWGICGFGITAAIFLLSRAVYRTRSRVWLWHVVTLSMSLCVMLSAALLIIFGRTEFIDTFNSIIALLLSNIMVALAVAERMREDRRETIRARTELVSNYAITPIGTFTLGADGKFLRANPVLEQLLGFSLSGAEVHWTDYFEEQDWDILAEKTSSGKEVEIQILPEATESQLPKHFIVRIALAAGLVEGSLQDITTRTETINQLQLLADNDPLTNVLNRRGIEKALDASLKRLALGEPCALAYVNLDPYKRINSLFGHMSGDEVLQQVCQRIKATLSDREYVGRIGGDEFIILFSDSIIGKAREAAARVIHGLNSTALYVGGRAFQLKSAMGIIEVTDGMDPSEMISAAGRACRDARKSHKDIVVYEQNSHELQEHTEELRLFDELEGGDSPKGLYLEMQPIMSMRNPLQTLNFEILLRVRNSTGVLVPTGKIIAAAEESGTITIIDKWVFSATLEWLAKHEHRLTKTEVVNVNLSGVSLNDDKFIDAFFAILERYEHLANRLCVEITEGVALQDLNRTRSFMKRLQKMGAFVALDDFGAGYTSFSYLKELPADMIKIDGALIKDMMANETNTAIIRTIVELARNLGMKSIAEWAEDCATLQALQEMGIDYVQGFVISKAKSPTDILNANTLADLIDDEEVLQFIRNIQVNV